MRYFIFPCVIRKLRIATLPLALLECVTCLSSCGKNVDRVCMWNGIVNKEYGCKMLRRRSKREKVTEGRGKLHKQVLHNLYLSLNTALVTRSMRM